MPTMNISLTPELINIIQHKVETGLYNNASEVVRDAIRQLDANAELVYELKLAHLKASLAPGLTQATAGEYVDYSVDKLIKILDK